VKAQDDTSVFGKVGTSAAEFEKALTGKKVVDAGQQGKYFWYGSSRENSAELYMLTNGSG
jgi:formamidopyrimidine-DNA glycosylase